LKSKYPLWRPPQARDSTPFDDFDFNHFDFFILGLTIVMLGKRWLFFKIAQTPADEGISYNEERALHTGKDCVSIDISSRSGQNFA